MVYIAVLMLLAVSIAAPTASAAGSEPCIDPPGDRFAVVMQSNPWRIALLNRDQSAVVRSANLDAAPDRVVADSRHAYITRISEGNVVDLSIIDLHQGAKVKELSLGSVMHGIYTVFPDPSDGTVVDLANRQEWRIDPRTLEYQIVNVPEQRPGVLHRYAAGRTGAGGVL